MSKLIMDIGIYNYILALDPINFSQKKTHKQCLVIALLSHRITAFTITEKSYNIYVRVCMFVIRIRRISPPLPVLERRTLD